MLKVNGYDVTQGFFGDGTEKITLSSESFDEYESNGNYWYLEWLYEPNEEMLLWFVVNHLHEITKDVKIMLHMPYIPNARMDRVHDIDEVFMMKHFAKFLNDLNLTRVFVLDPHSDVSSALINNVVIMSPEMYIAKVNHIVKPDVVFFPDAGAKKRYGNMIEETPITYGEKVRDWKTGKITGYDVMNKELIKCKKMLIIDDICSYGGTFFHAANALEKLGATSVNLYVTHLEDSVSLGEFIQHPLLDKIYTTKSIYTGSNPKVVVIQGEDL